MSGTQEFLTLDPVAMNVVNRVAAGSRLSGKLRFDGGLLVQGEIFGELRVNGPLVVWGGGVVRGRVRVRGDTYLFGQLGELEPELPSTTLECTGMVCIAAKAISTATLVARRMQLYEGADVRGPFKTMKAGQELPVLRDVFVEAG